MVDAARRGFLRGGFLTSEGRRDIDRQAEPSGVLPPGIAGNVDVGSCADCSHPCVDSCEAGIIKVHPEGHGLAGLPYLDFSGAGCTFCGACAHACPVEGVSFEPGTEYVLGLAVLDTGKCFAWQSVVCVSCRFACTRSAIPADSMSRPSIDGDACNGCGACVAVCPQDAIRVESALTSLP